MDDTLVKNMNHKLTVFKIVIVFLLTFLIEAQCLNKIFLSKMHYVQTRRIKPKNGTNTDTNKLRKLSTLKSKNIVVLMFNLFLDQVVILVVLISTFTIVTDITKFSCLLIKFVQHSCLIYMLSKVT